MFLKQIRYNFYKKKKKINSFLWLLLDSVVGRLQEMWLEKRWGDNVEHVFVMIHFLLEILQEPKPLTFEMFLVGIPTIFNVVILSPHGYLGQTIFLGMEDTTYMDR